MHNSTIFRVYRLMFISRIVCLRERPSSLPLGAAHASMDVSDRRRCRWQAAKAGCTAWSSHYDLLSH